MGGHIDVYLDCVSYYSYLAFIYLLKNRALLASYDITVEQAPQDHTAAAKNNAQAGLTPSFLGALMLEAVRRF